MVVTVEKLKRAIEAKLGLEEKDALDMAERVLNYFGYSNVIIDNALDQEDRKLFYKLHDAGILRTSWETILLLSGKTWRIFYWEIDERDLEKKEKEEEKVSAELPYESLPEEYWERAQMES